MRQVVADLKPDDARDCCDGAMVLMGIALAAAGPNSSPSTSSNVEFVRGGAKVFIARSKPDQTGEGRR